MPESNTELRNAPNPARLIFGLRDTGYDFFTAAADIVDNSIAAGANTINIELTLETDGRKIVYFGDDGQGMNEAGLWDAMRYGAPVRENLKSLGKFGLGLKTASSSICRRYSLVSRADATAPLQKLTWDLDHVEKVGDWVMVADAVTSDEQEVFEELCGDVGTLVVWEKCDRLLSKSYKTPGGNAELKAMNRRAERLREHCALIFHKYLNPAENGFRNVSIIVDGTAVDAWNPFYPARSEMVLSEAQTKLPIMLEDGSVHEATVRAWILPHSKDMSVDEEKEFAKISNRGQGFYIHRLGRVIHHGGYLGIWRADDPHWSLLRIEFEFGEELDDAFRVDVKKSQILLDPALEDGLKKLLTPAYREANNRYRRKQSAAVTGGAGIDHGPANRTIGDTQGKKQPSVSEVNAETGEATLSNRKGTGIKIIAPVENDANPAELYVDPVDSIPHGYLWEPCLKSSENADYNTAVRINQEHDFYAKVYSQAESGVSVEGIDLLLWALATAELDNTDEELQPMWEDIRDEVSSNLRKLLRKTPIPSDSPEE